MSNHTVAKQKLVLEYPVRVSPNLLYDYLSESFRLQEWFADKVEVSQEGRCYTFKWATSGEVQKATVVEKQQGEFIKFKFDDTKDDDTYLEFRIVTTELSQETILVIEDFVEPELAGSQEQLWDYQVKTLMHILGN